VNLRLEPVFREAAAVLAAPLSRLHQTCFPDDPWPPQAIADIIAVAGFFGRIAWEDGEATGLALAQGLGEECEILALGVVPTRRRSGIGTALLFSTMTEARHRGARRLFLEVAADNIAARALYGAHGFVQIGRRTNYYRRVSCLVDALVMRLLLST
jgi:[ribosomal protein S18]-alanine N-acetyltransferase